MPTAARIAAPYAAPFVGRHGVDRTAVDVGLNLPPQRRARAAAAETDALNRHAHLGKDRERVAQAERDAFHDRAHDVTAAVAGREADQRGAGVRIAMRRALAHQVRRPEHAVGARRHPRRLGGQLRRTTRRRRPRSLIAEPAQRQAGRLRDAHHVPAAGDRHDRTCAAGPSDRSPDDRSPRRRRPMCRSSR